ncbi:MAG TPA: preprotein translocase subunit SecY [Gammaproteobacteria bacterium]|jgi:preprotein translocase subunit SecY|nr:preprotein translocase subunit SecY [Gammaproteobacteria bacterium]
MLGGLGDIGKLTDLRRRLVFLLIALVVFRVGSHVPVPGIDPQALSRLFSQHSGGILDMFNMFSGGALKRLSIFALGVMPYISASIIMQMLAVVIPSLEQMRKEGASGQRRITRYTRYATVGLAFFQSLGAAIALQKQGVALHPGPNFLLAATVSLVTGTMFLMWLGEQVTERGVGNGISMLIFAGIVAGLPAAFGGTLDLVRTGQMNPLMAIVILALVLGVTTFVVFVERAQRRITVNYAKRQQGRRMYAAQSSHLPLKMNMSGVIPPIFASSIILFPATLGNWIGQNPHFEWLQKFAAVMSPGQLLYTVVYGLLIVFFCFFYTSLVFNSRETAENLKKSGAFIPGIRPGQQTAGYIDGVLTKLTLWGALYVTAVCLLPEILIVNWNVPFYFGGTSLLIIVVVVMDFMAQLQAHMMSHQYEGLLRKANLKGYGAAGQIR